jgi:hypothetical protein
VILERLAIGIDRFGAAGIGRSAEDGMRPVRQVGQVECVAIEWMLDRDGSHAKCEGTIEASPIPPLGIVTSIA